MDEAFRIEKCLRAVEPDVRYIVASSPTCASLHRKCVLETQARWLTNLEPHGLLQLLLCANDERKLFFGPREIFAGVALCARPYFLPPPFHHEVRVLFKRTG